VAVDLVHASGEGGERLDEGRFVHPSAPGNTRYVIVMRNVALVQPGPHERNPRTQRQRSASSYGSRMARMPYSLPISSKSDSTVG